jgi:hypothetical protein
MVPAERSTSNSTVLLCDTLYKSSGDARVGDASENTRPSSTVSRSHKPRATNILLQFSANASKLKSVSTHPHSPTHHSLTNPPPLSSIQICILSCACSGRHGEQPVQVQPVPAREQAPLRRRRHGRTDPHAFAIPGRLRECKRQYKCQRAHESHESLERRRRRQRRRPLLRQLRRRAPARVPLAELQLERDARPQLVQRASRQHPGDTGHGCVGGVAAASLALRLARRVPPATALRWGATHAFTFHTFQTHALCKYAAIQCSFWGKGRHNPPHPAHE